MSQTKWFLPSLCSHCVRPDTGRALTCEQKSVRRDLEALLPGTSCAGRPAASGSLSMMQAPQRHGRRGICACDGSCLGPGTAKDRGQVLAGKPLPQLPLQGSGSRNGLRTGVIPRPPSNCQLEVPFKYLHSFFLLLCVMSFQKQRWYQYNSLSVSVHFWILDSSPMIFTQFLLNYWELV